MAKAPAMRSQLVLPCSSSPGATANSAASQTRRRPASREVATVTATAHAVSSSHVTS